MVVVEVFDCFCFSGVVDYMDFISYCVCNKVLRLELWDLSICWMVCWYRFVCLGLVRIKVREYVYFKVFIGKGNGSRGDWVYEYVDWWVFLNGVFLICWVNWCVIGDYNYVVCKFFIMIVVCLLCCDSMRLVLLIIMIGVSLFVF